jgi:DNA topoisomerase I
LPKGTAPEDVDLNKALALLSLPREVGRHPEDGEPIRAGIGRFGPYVQHGKTYASLESPDEVFTVGLNRAVTLLAEKVARGPRFRRFGADPGRPLGDHPTKGGPIVAKNGRYGPYVSHAGVNATLPADKTPEAVTLDEAVVLLDARAERGAAPPRERRRKSARSANRATRPSTRPAAKAKSNAPKRPAAAGNKKSARRTTQAAE